jgi:hypothetical protein
MDEITIRHPQEENACRETRMPIYPRAAVELMMKVQDVMLQAMARKITWWQAAEVLGISDRHLRLWRKRYAEFAFRGLFDRRRGRPSPKRVPVAVVERVLELYRERYFDLNVRHFHEKLAAEHQIRLSYSWVKGLLQGRGWWRGDGNEERCQPAPLVSGRALARSNMRRYSRSTVFTCE